MQLRAYPMLSTRSRRAIVNGKKSFDRFYHYNPRGNLLTRFGRELGMSKEQAYALLMQEREHLLKIAVSS